MENINAGYMIIGIMIAIPIIAIAIKDPMDRFVAKIDLELEKRKPHNNS